MSRQAKGVLAAAVLVIGTSTGWWLSRGQRAGSDRAPAPAAPPSFAVAPAPRSPEPPASPSPEEVVDRIMQAWRAAILSHDADTVLMCDRTFLTEPGRYTAALVKSAQSDGDDRVRAFSTRVLGKLDDPLLIEIFRKQLADPSPFVRENAAWALGELATPAAGAAGDLEKTMKHDKADAVRRAAEQALGKVRGGGKSRGRAG
jgi:hypothetical protein